MRTQSRLTTIAVLLAALILGASASAQADVSLERAQRSALQALGVGKGDRPVIVFRVVTPVRAGTRITAAGRTRLPTETRARVAQSPSRADLLRAAGVSIVTAPAVMRVGAEPAWLFYADHGPYQAYQHPGRIALVGQRSGRVTLSRTLQWPPLLDGRLPYFLRSYAGYRNPRNRAFVRSYRAKRGARPAAVAAAPLPALGSAQLGLDAVAAGAPVTDTERQAAAQLAAERSCAVRVGDTLGNFYDATSFDQTRARLGAIFNRLARLDRGFVSVRYRVKTGTTLRAFVAQLVNERGCRDVFLYVAGGGYVSGGEPAVSIGTRGRSDGRVEQQVVTASMLREIMAEHPAVTFKLQLDAPGSGAFLPALGPPANLVLFISSAQAGQASFSALPPLVRGTSTRVANTYNPNGLLEFSNLGLRGIACFLQSAEEVALAAQAKADGSSRSFLGWMLTRGFSLCSDGSLLSQIQGGSLPNPVIRPFGFAPHGPRDRGRRGRSDDPGHPGDPRRRDPPRRGQNHAPVATNVAVTTAEDTPVALTLAGADSDGDALAYTVTAPPAGGTVSGGTGAARTFTPDPDFNGVATFTYAVSDGELTASATVTVTVRPVDDAPVVAVGAGTTAFVEDEPPVAVAPALTVSDVDGDPVQSAVVAITQGFAAGEDELLFTDQSGITGSWDAGTGVLRLTGSASVADYQAALRSIEFDNSSQTPSTAPRGVTFAVRAAGADSALATRPLTVTDVREPPTLGGGGGTVAWTEGDPAVQIDGAITVADVDDARLAGATVSITAGFQANADVLEFSDQNGITGAYDAATGVLRLSGDATLADYETALRSISFANGSDDPSTATRTVSFTATDGASAGNAISTDVTVTAVNDAPVLTAGGATAAYTEGDAGVAVDPAIAVADPDDARLESAVVSIAAGHEASEDVLVFANQNGITGTWDGAAGELRLTGSATVAEYQAALRSVRYRNSDGDDPSTADRTISFEVSDGALASNVAFVDVSVTRVNDAPVLGGGGNTVQFTEGDAAGVVVNGAITVSDVDDADLEGATVAIGSGFEAGEDALVFVNQSGIAGSYDTGTGVLTLTGTATLAQYETALRSIRYANSDGDAPSTADRAISFTVTDGDDDSAAVGSTVEVVAGDDAPVLGGGGTTATFTEGDATGPAVLPSATVADADDTQLTSATVAIAGGFQSGEDVLAFSDQNGIAGAYDAGTGELRLTGRASLADYQAALRSVTYVNASQNPSTADRTISAQAENGRASNAITATVTVTAVNDAPRLVAGGGPDAAFDEADGSPVAVDAGIAVSDIDDANLAGATVAITGGYQTGDELLFSDQNGIAGSWNAGTGELRLTGSASVVDYQAALRSVAFGHATDAPSTAPRTVSFTVEDGDDPSNTTTAGVTVTAEDDPPALRTSAGQTAWGGSDVAVDAALTVRDPDTARLTGATVAIESGYQTGEDVLTFADTAAITGSWDAGTGTLTLTGDATHADYQAALRSVQYQHVGGTLTAVTRTIRFTVADGAQSASDTKELILGEAPELDSPGAAREYAEGAAPVVIDATITVSDRDSANLAGATATIESGFATAEDELSATVAGTSISAVYTPASGTLRLTGSDTVANYERVLRTVAYANRSQNPSTATRGIRFTVTDGTLSDSATNSVTVRAVNDAPTVTRGGGSPTFTEEGAPVAVDPGLVAADVDSATLSSARVTISANYAGAQDQLGFTDQNGIIGSYSGGTLTLVGTATVAEYQAALRSVEYFNTDTMNPSTAARTISFVVNDGAADSAAATTTVTVRGVNDAPVLTSGATLSYTENDPATAIDPALTLTDADSANLVGATVQLGGGWDAAEDTLTFVNTARITGTFTRATGELRLAGADTPANYQAALRSVRYSNSSEDPSPTQRTVVFTVDDGSASANTATANAAIDVRPVNDAPTVAGETERAVGNTRVAYGTVLPAGEPGRTVASASVLTNDTDVDSPGPLAVNVATSPRTGDRGGSVSWNADGSFTYLPPAGFTGTETLTYAVTDQEPDAAEATGRVAVTVAERVFYVRNTAPAAGDGRSSQPFDTLAEADAAANATGDRIYVFRGDGTSAGNGGGVAMLDNQQLIGENKDLVVGGETIYDSDNAGSTRPVIGGSVAVARGNLVTGLAIATSGSGAAIAGAAGDADGTVRDVEITATGADGGVSLNGTSGSWTLDGLAVLTANGDGITATSAGSVTITGGATATVAAGGTGRGLVLSRTALSGQVDSVTTAGSAGGAAVSIADTTGSLTLDDLNLASTRGGLVLDGANAIVVNGSGDARVTAAEEAVAIRTTTTNPATAPQVTLTSATSTGGANGIALNDADGATLSVAGGSLTGQTTAAVAISGGNGAVTYGGTIGNGTGLSAQIDNRTGGAIALSGAINDNADAGGGISMTGNSGGSTTFSNATKTLNTGGSAAVSAAFGVGSHALTFAGGGLDVDTTTGAGFSATGSGGIVRVVGGGNTIDTGAGTGLTINGPDIAAEHVTFQRVSANGAPAGIVLADTGSAGGLRVTGTGSAGSGGTIQSSTDAGVRLSNTSDVQLASLNVTNGGNDGIRGSNVNGFSLTGSSQITSNGDAVGEHGMDFVQLTGTATITGATVSGSAERNLAITNDSGTLTANVTNGAFSNTASGRGGVGADGIFVEGTGTGTMNVNVTGTELRNNREDHIQVTTDASTTVAQNVVINGVRAANTVGASGGAITLNPGGNAVMDATVTGSTSVGARDEAITVDSPGSRLSPQPVQIDVSITGNTIGQSGVALSGASAGNGIGIRSNGNANVRALVQNNTIQQYVNLAGLNLIANDGDGTLDATVLDNTITQPGNDGVNSGQNGILAVFGGADAAERPTVCLDMRNNQLFNAGADAGSGADQDIRVRQRDLSVVRMPGYAGGAMDRAASAAFILANNSRGGTPTVGTTVSGVAPGGFFDTAAGAPCAQP